MIANSWWHYQDVGSSLGATQDRVERLMYFKANVSVASSGVASTSLAHGSKMRGISIYIKRDVCMYEIESLKHRSTDPYENWHVYVFFVWRMCLGCPLCCSSSPGGATAYQLLHPSINRQVANRVTENDANLTLSPTFRYVSNESPL
ncbi:uncharacterized protein TNCV_4425311 [Trichonephila clavipes]|nr:uncharacterized protein TNCV_4425311 [Trichonephila clavipes]